MKFKVLFILPVLFVSVLVGGIHAEPIKKWVDHRGKTHYGVQPPKGTSSEILDKAPDGNPSNKPDVEAVILYSTAWCGYCRKARAYLQRKGIDYQELDIEKDRFAMAAYKRAGGVGVPFLVKGDSVLRGFRASSYDRFFERE